ncbi:hypothetical protein JX266_001715 [Neoarthrinium moseri]|nr:hypothetical protein JX266_001715 [Neoarthrinium moseri]
MLGWALKKGIQSATGATNAPPEEGDTTQIDVPDTPAPVFAARAIRHAIFGTPAPAKDGPPSDPRRDATDATGPDAAMKDSRSPAKPTGILLTPGTATARRKRVSFDQDTKAGTNGDAAQTVDALKKLTLQQRLEESRVKKSKSNNTGSKPQGQRKAGGSTKPVETVEDGTDDEWEDEICNHDVTVDLNEPHSRSGKYWKSEFSKYADDARVEMEKLVKYKHLAKCYAQKKDAEAVDLNQKLKEEQEKVVKMEKKIKDLASQLGGTQGKAPTVSENAALEKKLAEKTELAAQYREQVKELAALLRNQAGSDDKSNRRRVDTSPGAEKNLLETNRELRRARSELKGMDRLRQEVERLKSDLLFSEQRTTKLAEENRRLVGEASQSSGTQKLERQVRELQEASEQKDNELKKLRKDYAELKENAKAQRSQALQVLKEKNGRITELESKIETLKGAELQNRSSNLDEALARHSKITRGLKSDIATLNKPSIHQRARLGQPKRSVSAEDLTLELTQHSHLNIDTDKRSAIPKDTWSNRRLSADWTDSLQDIEEQIRREKRQQMEARKQHRNSPLDDFDVDVSRRLEMSHTSALSSGARRVMSDRINEALPRETRQRSVTSRGTLGGKVEASRRGAALTASRHPAKHASLHPQSSFEDAPVIDLLQNRFAKLGGPNPDDTAMAANVSRCTLPADRESAARARLAQRRRERQRATDKENMRP